MTNFFSCKIDDSIAEEYCSQDLAAALLVMKPKASLYPLIRVGGNSDGAYLLPDDLSGVQACFSPGVNNIKTFEDELTDRYNIVCHMADKSSDLGKLSTPLKIGTQTFKKKWLDITGESDTITLEDWIEELCPNAEDDLLLQMDIEGAEYRNLLQASDATLKRFRIMVIELHGLHMILNPGAFRDVFKPLLNKIDSLFQCVHAHPNNCCGDFLVPGTELNLPNVHELTFLRRDRMSMVVHTQTYLPHIPHPLDISRNVPSNAPLFLNDGWIVCARSSESRIKMLEEMLDFEKYSNSKKNTEILSTMYSLTQKMYQAFIGEKNENESYNLTNVAIGKPFILSSNYGHWPKVGIVGDKDPFFFHTKVDRDEYITIDLGEMYRIWKIGVKNRSDGCFERANFLFYMIHNLPDWTDEIAYPIQVSEDFVSGRAIQSDTLVPGITGRYVTIFSPYLTALHFSAIQVFADAPAIGVRPPARPVDVVPSNRYDSIRQI